MSLNVSINHLICSFVPEIMRKKLNVDQISQREPSVPGATDSPLLCFAQRKLNSLFTCHSLDFVNCRGDRGTGWGGGGCERTSVPALQRWWHIWCHVKPKCARPLTDTGHTRIEPHARWRMSVRADSATNKNSRLVLRNRPLLPFYSITRGSLTWKTCSHIFCSLTFSNVLLQQGGSVRNVTRLVTRDLRTSFLQTFLTRALELICHLLTHEHQHHTFQINIFITSRQELDF